MKKTLQKYIQNKKLSNCYENQRFSHNNISFVKRHITAKIFLIFALIICSIQYAISAESLNFNGQTYNLKNIKKNVYGGYSNEYQSKETSTERIIIYNIPKAKSPLAEAKELSNYITALYAKKLKEAPVAISYNEKKDQAIVNYILPIKNKDFNEKNIKHIAFYICKYSKSTKGKGVTVIQYTKIFTPEEIKISEIYSSAIKTMTAIDIPDIIEEDIK